MKTEVVVGTYIVYRYIMDALTMSVTVDVATGDLEVAFMRSGRGYKFVKTNLTPYGYGVPVELQDVGSILNLFKSGMVHAI